MVKKGTLGLATLALLLGGCSTSYMKARAAEKQTESAVEESLAGERYVAIGSSFAAGPMLPPPKPGAPVRCGQSLNNYPTLLAERFGMVLTDRSCSGATTENVLGPWGDIPPQIDSVTPQTRLVTITMGGNDLSYIGNLFSATCHYRNAHAAPGTKPRTCSAVRVPKDVDYARVEMQLNEIIRRVRVQAPRARIVLVQYLTPLPQPGVSCMATPVSEPNAAIVRTIGRRLAEITDKVGRERNVLVVEMNLASADHTPCDEVPWMIGSPEGYNGSQGLQWHLNFAGMQATANDIAWWLVQSGVKLSTLLAPAAPAAAAAAATAAPQPEVLSEACVTASDILALTGSQMLSKMVVQSMNIPAVVASILRGRAGAGEGGGRQACVSRLMTPEATFLKHRLGAAPPTKFH